MRDSSITVTWIDDDFGEENAGRSSLVRDMREITNGALKLETLEPCEIIKWLEDVQHGDVQIPDIILVDLFLQSTKAGKARTPSIFDHGTKLVGLLITNERLADVPKYLVSRALKEEQVGRQTERFDWVLAHNQLAVDGPLILMRDGLDYRKLSAIFQNRGDTNKFNDALEGFLALLQTPDVCKGLLREVCKKILRDMFMGQYENLGRIKYDDDEINISRGFVLDIARWIRSILLNRSGPIIRDLHAATMLGSKLEPFKSRISDTIRKEEASSIYSGVFFSTESRRWWKDAVLNWGLNKFPNSPITSPSKLAKFMAEHLGLREDEYATCAVCKERWPETVARDSEEPTEWRQVHWRCSDIVEESSVPVGFDELREFTMD